LKQREFSFPIVVVVIAYNPYSRLQSPSFLGHVVLKRGLRYKLSGVALGTRMMDERKRFEYAWWTQDIFSKTDKKISVFKVSGYVWTRSQNFCCSRSLICRKILSVAPLSAPPRRPLLIVGRARDKEKESARGPMVREKGKERPAPAFSLFPSSPRALSIFLFYWDTQREPLRRREP